MGIKRLKGNKHIKSIQISMELYYKDPHHKKVLIDTEGSGPYLFWNGGQKWGQNYM